MKIKNQPKIKLKKIKANKGNIAEQLLPPSYRPLSSWNYFWRSVLYIIPVLGWAFMIAHAVAAKSRHGRSFARGCILFAVLLIATAIAAYGMGYLKF